MNIILIKRLTKLLRETADRIDSGNCEMSEDEAIDIMSALTHQAISKEDACIQMNMSRSQFDECVREGLIPRGRKRRGFKELRWYKDELEECARSMKRRQRGGNV